MRPVSRRRRRPLLLVQPGTQDRREDRLRELPDDRQDVEREESHVHDDDGEDERGEEPDEHARARRRCGSGTVARTDRGVQPHRGDPHREPENHPHGDRAAGLGHGLPQGLHPGGHVGLQDDLVQDVLRDIDEDARQKPAQDDATEVDPSHGSSFPSFAARFPDSIFLAGRRSGGPADGGWRYVSLLGNCRMIPSLNMSAISRISAWTLS